MPNSFLYIQTVIFQTIQFRISTAFFVYTQLNVKTVLFQTIQFSISKVSSRQWSCRYCYMDALLGGDVLLWTPAYGQAKAGQPARTHIQKLCEDSGCSHEELPEAKNDREKGRERVRDIRASGTTWKKKKKKCKIVLFKRIQFSMSAKFKCQNSSISNKSVWHKYTI